MFAALNDLHFPPMPQKRDELGMFAEPVTTDIAANYFEVRAFWRLQSL